MARWQKIMLIVGLILAGIGISGQVRQRLAPATESVVESSPGHGVTSPGEHRSFVGTGQTGKPSQPEATPAEPSAVQTNTPWMTRVGIGFIGGFVLGWAFRAFLKLMSLAAIVLGGLLLGLSYFNVVNIDLSAAREKYASASAWISDQGERLGDAAMAHLPASSSTLMGLLAGLKRKL